MTDEELALVTSLLEKVNAWQACSMGLHVRAKKESARASTVFFFKGEAAAFDTVANYLSRLKDFGEHERMNVVTLPALKEE